jgi:hypothetical protein
LSSFKNTGVSYPSDLGLLKPDLYWIVFTML